MRRFSAWLAETHSSRFELRRHFFRRFFESELIADPGQAKIVAGGALAILISLSLIFTQAYYHKYRVLGELADPLPFLRSELADILFVIVLAMTAIALFTTLQWPSLFPSLRDYLTLAALPMRMRDIFEAKFTALLAFATLTTAAVTILPSVVLPAVMSYGWDPHPEYQVAAIFISGSLAALFVFFVLLAVQGVLLNILPVRIFPRVSLAMQGCLLALCLGALPLVFSIPSLHPWMSLRPDWAMWVPPLWFLGLDQLLSGHADPLTLRLGRAAFAGTAAAAAAAVLTYAWSYRRHRTRVIESPSAESTAASAWLDSLSDKLFMDPPALAVFGFIVKSLGRSRQHRLILTAFCAIALAVIAEGFAGLFLSGGSAQVYRNSAAFRQTAIAVPLALSLFLLTGLRYLFRLPVELRANWIFRIHEPGNAVSLLAGAESFMVVCGAVPAALLSLPIEIALLGASGIAAAVLCFEVSLILVEILLFPLDRIPFTSSYLPGQRPLIDVVMAYLVATAIYVAAVSTAVRAALQNPVWAVALMVLFLLMWWRARRIRHGSRQIHHLGFEEAPEPAVQLLGIDRD